MYNSMTKKLEIFTLKVEFQILQPVPKKGRGIYLASALVLKVIDFFFL